MLSKRFFNISFFSLLFLNLFFLSSILSFQITQKGERVSLPDLEGMTIEEAREALSKKKLFLVQSGVQLHDRYELGQIISQDPPADSKAKINDVVKVTVSGGKEKVVVPLLRGRSLPSVAQILRDSGLKKGKISQIYSSRYSAGKIISQNPLPEVEVGKDFQVSLLVSQGQRERKYLMPDLIGRDAASVITRLKEIGFHVGNLRYRHYPGLDSGIIINQSPSPGSKIQKRNLITMEVSK
jgi:beta-lactam-binding protein with PASTA domain